MFLPSQRGRGEDLRWVGAPQARLDPALQGPAVHLYVHQLPRAKGPDCLGGGHGMKTANLAVPNPILALLSSKILNLFRKLFSPITRWKKLGSFCSAEEFCLFLKTYFYHRLGKANTLHVWDYAYWNIILCASEMLFQNYPFLCVFQRFRCNRCSTWELNIYYE